MKIGLRKPSVEKRIKARTTAKVKRKVKGEINPFYGMKGMGYVKDPERAIENKIYKKVTVDSVDLAKKGIEYLKNDDEQEEDVVYAPDLEEEEIEQPEFKVFPLFGMAEIICLIVTIIQFIRGANFITWLLGIILCGVLFFVFKRIDV